MYIVYTDDKDGGIRLTVVLPRTHMTLGTNYSIFYNRR